MSPSAAVFTKRRRRCVSWRPSSHPHEKLCEPPGKCVKCWTICRNKLHRSEEDRRDGFESPVRCPECIEMLMRSPAGWVRLALVSEPDPPLAVLQGLAGDGDFAVAATARWQAEHRSQPAPPGSIEDALLDAAWGLSEHPPANADPHDRGGPEW
jgi:hypothetical protein